MRKIITFTLALLAITTFANGRNDDDVVLHHGGSGNGYELVYIDPPRVTYDEELNELYVYFGTTGTIDLVCDDGTGAPYYFIYGDYHSGNSSTTYYYLPSGYYTITIHSVYGVNYTGNFTVS